MRTAADGNLKTLILIVLALVVVLVVGSWYPQFSQGYEVQTYGKLACNDAIKIARFGPTAAKDANTTFMEGVVRAGVHLKPKDYTMTVEHDRNSASWKCKVSAHYPVDASVFAIGDILALKPYHFEKRVSFTHEVSDTY